MPTPSSKKTNNKTDDAYHVFSDEAEEKRYKRYQHACYRNLVLKALLFFLLGLLAEALFKVL